MINLTQLSTNGHLFEVTFTENLELKSAYSNGRKVRLTPLRETWIINAFESAHNLEEILADTIHERRNRNYSDC